MLEGVLYSLFGPALVLYPKRTTGMEWSKGTDRYQVPV